MAETKMAVVALILTCMLIASTVPTVTAECFEDCYNRCSNGKELASCGTMCATACVVPVFPGSTANAKGD